ncbi:hypothetical protein PCANC_03732 [Puccinia coronata f. sp. avenae]|uniref:Uncharacterized protein n=1 Tax=Puccinia coronata f. sp. avenae TaxID=200324 RepID=A0A2N5VVD3_9BASI|nr:hypothetical protein PCASD_20344 [Puccinia coronata f. sp. avenae]PLW29172.1 hypothetical protein PCASD_10937 [Puccinia coronata f. sp. avenae]PLW53958.1 hypothetical protein PCANC_03732 [Puccinia coronata f. sp. avenae]
MSMQAELASLEPNRQYCLTTGRHYSQDHPDELSGICRLIIAYDYSAQHVFSTTKISPIASFLGTTGDFPIPSNRLPKLNFLQPRCISESITFWAGTLELSLRASRSLDAFANGSQPWSSPGSGLPAPSGPCILCDVAEVEVVEYFTELSASPSAWRREAPPQVFFEVAHLCQQP